MKRLVRSIIFSVIAAMSVSCTQKAGSMYRWCDYSESLYSCKKNQSSVALAEHQALLERIITESNEHSMRVPPGVCAELGYIYAGQNRTREAIGLFQLEKQTYPEAVLLMDRLISRIESRTAPPIDSKTGLDETATPEKGFGWSKP
jgi:hypothetical protein